MKGLRLSFNILQEVGKIQMESNDNKSFTLKKLDISDLSELQLFVDFPKQLYQEKIQFNNFYLKLPGILKSNPSHSCYLLLKGSEKKIIGRMAAGINPAIVDEQGVPYGQIGLFEVIEDFEAFSFMITEAEHLLSGSKNILFPFFVSTWHNYRMTTKEEFNFFLEQPCKLYYGKFIQKYGYDTSYIYKSSFNDNLDKIEEKNLASFKKAEERGVKFRNFDKTKWEEELKILYGISCEAFKENPFYSEISLEGFLDLYRGSLKIIDEKLITIAFSADNKPIGFIFCLPDLTVQFQTCKLDTITGKIKFFLTRKKTKTMILKSTCMLKECRNSGVYGSMVYQQARYARSIGYTNMIGAFYSAANVSQKILAETLYENEYKLFTLKQKEII